MQSFGERLRDLRHDRKLTQQQLAKELNVSGNTIHAWETDKQEPSMSTLLKLSIMFGVSLDYLYGRTDY